MSSAGWFHCFSGIAGDMALPVSGWTLEAEPVLRAGMASTHVVVHTKETSVVRTYSHIAAMVEEARLPDRVRRRALATFEALAVAEGRIHRRPPEQVHFHEVGALDAIVDIVGTAAALEVLDVDEVFASAVANGTGMTRAAHGTLPIPAPAVLELLQRAPTYGLEIPFELTTPTGAALLAANVVGWGPMPSMEIGAIGFGAGSREIDGRPNVVQVVLGTRIDALGSGQPLLQLDVNVDDATGETLAHAIGALLDAGAHDAWITPIVMKKGRPAYTVSAMCDPALGAQVAEVLRRETGSLGVRGAMLDRWPAARSTEEVEVAGFPLRVKVSAGRVKVEHDDAARIAKRTGLPLREVISLAEESARRGHGLVSLPTRAADRPPDDSA